MSLIDRAKAHFEKLGTQSISIEEWTDEDGNPTIIYWTPITLSEKNKIAQKTGGNVLADASVLADIVIWKALDKDGKKLFTIEDKIALMHKVDSEILARIANAMVVTPSVEDLKKN